MNTCLAPCPVVFDLDGTLIDSAPDIHAAANAVLRLHGARPLTLDQIRSFVGGGVDVLWHRIEHAAGLPAEMHRDLLASFMTRYHDASSLTRLYPNVIEMLGQLADRGHPLGICTNKPMVPTLAILDHFGIAGIFQAVIAGDSLPQKKPDPEPLRATFAALGAHPQRPSGLFVGDSEFDAQCARNARVPFLIFTKGYRNTPLEQMTFAESFDDHARLPALVEARRLAD
ncbi:MAG: phosphoglycolate phosphatase [Paracoccus sp. (in: a-proteobacteria)]|uniref:phosphoglycolate phosphatase n=1 Tax=Paracoccus sp. TaxID=267 RepID=UPI0039E64AD2